ncbi:MAG TPA: hypothetical protein PKW98_02990 [Candidatus Wallbacteria bacterium]|nr:MAG: hypothetical protein BWY32_00399 [bacterium ADurb.Bin243]HOD39544.1 hypothetical protein [Candidatus Wallbacteria bacterium]HPG56761.1 hypothetical protein [Candidatus Wallbacteria bacterium]
MKKKKKNNVKKFDLAKAVKKSARKNTAGLNLATRDHGDETVYKRERSKKIAGKETEDIE